MTRIERGSLGRSVLLHHAVGHYLAVVQRWDVAVKPDDTSDYSVRTTWGVARNNVYHLLHGERVKLPYRQLLALARRLIARYRPAHVLVEDAANGSALAQELGRSGPHVTVTIRPRFDTLSGAEAATPAFEAGRVLLPGTADWRSAHIQEFLGFPVTRYDDQVDSTSQFIDWAEERFLRYNVNPVPGGPMKEDSWLP